MTWMGPAACAWGWNATAADDHGSKKKSVHFLPTRLLETKCIEVFAARHENVLMPVEHVSDRGIAWIRYETGVPKRFAVTRVEGDEVPRAVAAEQQVAGRGQQGLGADVRGVFPGDLAAS